MKTEMDLWIEQLRRHARAIDELKRVSKLGRAKEAKNWINNYHKEYLTSAIVGIMKLVGIDPTEIKETYDNFDENRLVSYE